MNPTICDRQSLREELVHGGLTTAGDSLAKLTELSLRRLDRDCVDALDYGSYLHPSGMVPQQRGCVTEILDVIVHERYLSWCEQQA
jgi:hypothetical protein